MAKKKRATKKTTTKRKAAARKSPRSPAFERAQQQVAPITDVRKLKLVVLAMEKASAPTRRSRKSTALKLSVEILFQAAQRRIIDNETKESISADLHEFMVEAHVHSRSLDRWLDAVYHEYWKLLYSSVRKMALAANEADALNDPEAAVDTLVARLSAIALRSTENWDDLSVSERHVVLRSLEAMPQAVKLLADTRYKSAQAEKIHDAIETARRLTKGRKGCSGEKLLSIDQALDRVAELAGLTSQITSKGAT